MASSYVDLFWNTLWAEGEKWSGWGKKLLEGPWCERRPQSLSHALALSVLAGYIYNRCAKTFNATPAHGIELRRLEYPRRIRSFITERRLCMINKISVWSTRESWPRAVDANGLIYLELCPFLRRATLLIILVQLVTRRLFSASRSESQIFSNVAFDYINSIE